MSFDNSKFKRLRQLLGMTQKDFADKIKSSQQVIAMIESDKRGIPASVREGFYKTYGVSYEVAIKCETKEDLNKCLEKRDIPLNIQINQIVPVKYYRDAQAAAGLGEMLPEISEEEVLYMDKRWLENIRGVKASNAILIRAKGDSMDSGLNKPEDIQDGDLLLVDTSIKDVINNKIFVIQQKNELRVKRIVKEFNGDIYLISNNNKYSPEIVKEESNIIGKVVWNGTKENM